MRVDDHVAIDMDRIVKEYGDSLLRTAFLYLNDRYLAEDAVQDALVNVYRHYGDFQGRSAEKTWITRILINVCKNYRRSNWWKRTEVWAVLADIPGEDPALYDDSLLCAIMALPVKYKEVILLYYYQDLKTKEVAAVLSCPVSTVSVRLKRARELLKKTWKGGDESEW